jgi:hypothetical protein
MIKDTLLVSALVISFVLLYRIYIQSQKINNLEEKFNILDNFTQTMFKYIVTNESKEKEKENIITYSNNDNKSNNVSDNQNSNEMNIDHDSEKESEFHEYNLLKENIIQENNSQDHITQENVIQEISENYENKEIMSEMVSQLKETLLQNNKELIEQEINEVEELKQELKQDLKKSESSDGNNDELFNILNNSDVPSKSETNDLKKKEEDLMKMKMGDIKALAKLKNIPLLHHNKPKKKEVLVQNLLSQS